LRFTFCASSERAGSCRLPAPGSIAYSILVPDVSSAFTAIYPP
jgi:hypothetical protein